MHTSASTIHTSQTSLPKSSRTILSHFLAPKFLPSPSMTHLHSSLNLRRSTPTEVVRRSSTTRSQVSLQMWGPGQHVRRGSTRCISTRVPQRTATGSKHTGLEAVCPQLRSSSFGVISFRSATSGRKRCRTRHRRSCRTGRRTSSKCLTRSSSRRQARTHSTSTRT